METLHPENGDSPFAIKSDDAASGTGSGVAADEDLEYVDCPVEGCGEMLPRAEMDYHLELHAEEAGVGDSRSSPSPETAPVAVADSGPSLSASGPAPSSRTNHRHNRRDKDRDRDRDRERDSPRNGHSDSRSSHHKESSSTPQSKAISAWKRLLKMPSSFASSSPDKARSSRRNHGSDPVTASEKQANAKRLGVSMNPPLPSGFIY